MPVKMRTQLRVRSAWLVDRTLALRTGHGARLADRGAAAVEMALVLPLLLMLIFGIIDFGRLLNKQIALTEAARDAARVASFGGSAEESTAKAAARATSIAGNDVRVSTTACSDPGEDAEVTLTYDFTFVTPVGLLGGGFDGKSTLTARGVVPCQ